MSGALGVGNRSQIRERPGCVAYGVNIVGRLNGERCTGIGVDESCEVNAFGVSKIDVSGPICDQFLLVAKVRSIGSRIAVVAAEHRNARLKRKPSPGWSERDDSRPLRLRTIGADKDLGVGGRNTGASAISRRRSQRTRCNVTCKQRLLLN